MSLDAGLTDQCIFLQPGTPNFWESPDIRLNAATTHPGEARVGANLVEVVVHKGDCTVAEPVLVDVFVCNPSIGVVPPGVIANASKAIPSGVIPAGGAIPGTVSITWNIAPGTPATEPDGPGHRCLVARSYPASNNPDPGDFHVQTGPVVNPPGTNGDPHVAQKNISISPLTMKRAKEGTFQFNVHTANLNPQQAGLTLRAVNVLKPTPAELDVLLPDLKKIHGFKKISTTAAKSFSLQVSHTLHPVVRDHTRRGCIGFLLGLLGGADVAPSYEVDIQLAPKHLIAFPLLVDLSGSQSGDAHVFHLTQANGAHALQGGLTVVTVVV